MAVTSKNVFRFLVFCALGTSQGFAGSAKNGQGGMTVSPTSIYASTTNNFTFSFRAQKSTYNPGSQATLLVPAGWTSPQSNDPSGPGYVTVSPVLGSSTATIAGISGTGSLTITINFSTAQKQGGFDITYRSGVGPTNGGLYKFTAQTRQAGGQLRELRTGSPMVNVNNPSKTNTSVSVTSSLNPCTYGDIVSFTATVTPAISSVTGTVTFFDGSVIIGTVPLNSSGQANITTNRFSVPDSPSWITATYSGNASYNGNGSAILYQNVNPAVVVVSGLQVSSKTYDASTDAILDTSNAVLSGVVSGDDVSLDTTSATASFDDENSGAGKSVTVNGLMLAGTDSGNYTNNPVASLQANIVPSILTVTANDTNRAFGAPNPAFTASYSGFAGNDNTSVLVGSPAFSTVADSTSSVAGSPYTIQVTNGTLSAANYTFAFVNGKLTITSGSNQPQKILSIVALPGGSVSLQCSGGAAQSYLLQGSTTLLPGSWITLATNTTDGNGLMSFADRFVTNQPMRFYRTALP